MLEAIRSKIARFIAPPKAAGKRMYANARGSRLSPGFGSGGTSSADAELGTSLTQLRARSRQMVRDSAFAKRARTLIVNNVIGSGVGMQAQVISTRGALRTELNASIELAFYEWSMATSCHTGGKMHFHDLERACMGQVFDAGEVFIRMHFSAFGDSEVPLALEMIESERVPLDIADPNLSGAKNEIRHGIEVDSFGRALAYYVRQRHPGDIHLRGPGTDKYERVPADQMFHLMIVDRWPQTRGEPWMHAVLRKIDDMAEYSGSELSAARASSYYFATITTPEGDKPLDTDETEDGKGMMDIEPLTIQELKPGEELDFHMPNRPNSVFDQFVRAMLREMAAGCGTSYASLSCDYSQSNYSSSRLALLDDRDLYKVMQQWWLRSFRLPLHKVWLRQAALSGAIRGVTVEEFALAPRKFEAVLFKPRGWSWIDPTKEVNAYKEAIKAGLTTLTDVIAQTADGRDIEDVIATRRRELDMLDAADVVVDTTVVEEAPAAAPPPADPPEPEDEDGQDEEGEGDTTDRGARVVLMNGSRH